MQDFHFSLVSLKITFIIRGKDTYFHFEKEKNTTLYASQRNKEPEIRCPRRVGPTKRTRQ